MSMPDRIVVTGGAGFIGSELVRQLVDARFDVVVVDNLVNGRRENLEGLDPDRCRLLVADVRDEAAMKRAMDGADVLFHLACLGVRHSIHSPRENHDVNATATLDLLALARRSGLARFVCVSTSEVYGSACQVPMTEAHRTYPTTAYGASKLAGECYARAYYDTYGYPTVIVRPFNAFGPRSHHEGDSGEVIPKFMLRALAGRPLVVFGDGAQTRDFMYVGDAAAGILAAGFEEAAIGETINVGTGRTVSINALAQKISEVLERPVEISYDDPRPGDVRALHADITKAEQLLRFAPQVALEDGLRQLHAWYMSRGVAPEELLATDRVHNWVAP
jgi:UDP-glucose 4-epimerase